MFYFLKKTWSSIVSWYEKTYKIQLTIATVLFLLQVVHLVWLFGSVIWFKFFRTELFTFSEFFEKILILIDYTEIPAIVSVSIIYIKEFKKTKRNKDILYLIFLNLQWLHIFWITDEFVVGAVKNTTILPSWLAIIAILIDYLEVPVMIETVKKLIFQYKNGIDKNITDNSAPQDRLHT